MPGSIVTSNVVFDAAGTNRIELVTDILIQAASNVNIPTANVGIGTSAPPAKLTVYNSSANSEIRTIGDGQGSITSLYRYSSNNTAPQLQLYKARGSYSSPTIVSSGDYAGSSYAFGYDGANFQQVGLIRFAIDGTPGTGSMPGRIEFATTANGSGAVTERMRIDSSGNVGIGTASPIASLDVSGSYHLGKANQLAQTLTDAATVTWDTSLGQIATVTLGGSRTMAAPTNLKVGTYILHVIQGGSGSYTLTWNSVFKWPAGVAPTLTTTVSYRDVMTYGPVTIGGWISYGGERFPGTIHSIVVKKTDIVPSNNSISSRIFNTPLCLSNNIDTICSSIKSIDTQITNVLNPSITTGIDQSFQQDAQWLKNTEKKWIISVKSLT